MIVTVKQGDKTVLGSSLVSFSTVPDKSLFDPLRGPLAPSKGCTWGRVGKEQASSAAP